MTMDKRIANPGKGDVYKSEVELLKSNNPAIANESELSESRSNEGDKHDRHITPPKFAPVPPDAPKISSHANAMSPYRDVKGDSTNEFLVMGTMRNEKGEPVFEDVKGNPGGGVPDVKVDKAVKGRIRPGGLATADGERGPMGRSKM
ncbi:hypothetical protein HDU85_001137 [Gaertneriomyces sp. JEL0708]|nr:hypothetical protein HDU85_001137 [Gaertneriomyces sp. JEL0708]